jgi:hypothetical protein
LSHVVTLFEINNDIYSIVVTHLFNGAWGYGAVIVLLTNMFFDIVGDRHGCHKLICCGRMEEEVVV